MRAWLASLAPRDRIAVIIGGVFVAVALLYGVIWAPLDHEVARLRDSVAEQRALAAWMQQAAQEARRLRSAAFSSQGLGGRSLLSVVDQSARAAGLSGALKRVQPDGDDTVRVSLERAGFDAVVSWIGALAQSYRIQVSDLSVEREGEGGYVSARLTLTKGGS